MILQVRQQVLCQRAYRREGVWHRRYGLIRQLEGLCAAGKLLVNMEIWPSAGITLGAFALSVCLGILFGIYPAAKASKLQPVEALRAD